MRSQVYEWDASSGTAMTVATSLGKRVSVFVGGVGNNITKPAETTATEFVVIEDIATTPSTQRITSSTQITSLTMVSRELQVLTHEVSTSNLLSTFTLTFTSYRVKFGMLL